MHRENKLFEENNGGGGGGGAPANPNPPAPAKPADGAPDPVKLAEENGKLKAELEEHKKFRKQAEPVLETLWGDSELLDKAQAAHKKRLGMAADPAKPGDPADPKNPKPPVMPVSDPDTRNAVINNTYEKFEEKTGINKLSKEKQEEVRGMIGQMLKETLDPKGNKTISQVFEEVSLTKLPWYLDNAYKLITRDEDIKSAVERGKSEAASQYDGDRGIMGSPGGGSIPIDQVTLSGKEKEVARKMGMSEDEYLKNKKELIQMRNAS